MLAVDVSDRLHRRVRRQVVELRPPALVGFHGEHLGADAQLDRVVGDVVRQLAANQAHRDGAVRQIVDGAWNPRHLLWIRLRAYILARSTEDTKGTKDTEENSSPAHPALPAPPAHYSFTPHPLQNFASASFPASQLAHTRSASEREGFSRAFLSWRRFARSRSICSR